MRSPSSGKTVRLSSRLAFLTVLLLIPGAACRGSEEVDWVVKRPADVPRAALEFRFVLDGKAEGALEVADAEGQRMWVEKEIVISSADVYEVHVGLHADLEHYVVTMFFTPQAAQRLHDATEHNLGRQMALMLNGFVMIAPRIQSSLGPSAMIAGSYTKEEAVKLAEQIAP